GTDMSLYAVFTQLGLEVRLAPIMTEMICVEDDDSDLRPRKGTQPGLVGRTDFITDEHEDAKWIPKAFGKRLENVQWITKPLWRDLALIHGN
ncbi:MAG: hypothetical protein Q9179_007977, partial [Wetmoreana sp. 5 TL-2023]